jgi:hypothetical protein
MHLKLRKQEQVKPKISRLKQIRDCPQNGIKSLPAIHSIGTNIHTLQGTQKTQPPKNQHPNAEMGTLIK